MKHIMELHEILQFLPHRYPFLLVDRVIELELGKSLVAIKNVTINEPYFQGHFPQQAVMPGVLILEALAQASCVLACKTTNNPPDANTLYLLGSIENARFKRVVRPGDQLRLEVELLKHKQGVWKFKNTALVDSELVCSAEIICAEKVNKS